MRTPVAQQTKEPEAASFKIEVKVDKVLVPVVVRDARHHAVPNRRKEDFQVFDRDKPQVISGFTVEKRGLAESDTEGGNLPATSTPHATSQGTTTSQRSA